jgi:hypothetical protein
MRVPIDYTYPEAYGNAYVSYSFPVGKLVRLASGGVCRIETLRAGMQFELEGGGFADVTDVRPLRPWPKRDPVPDANGNVLRRVLGTVKHTGAVVVEMRIGSTTLTTTPDHLFWSVTRNNWIPVKELGRGEMLSGADGRTWPVEEIGKPRLSLVDLYNFEVEVSHTYFVGDPPVLVHNGYGCIRMPAYERELIEADRLSIRAANQIGAAEAELHHIATIYEGEGRWASKFKGIFSRAGYTLEDDINKIMIRGHFGPHGDYYNSLIYKELLNGTRNATGTTFRSAFEATMQKLRARVSNPMDILNVLISEA